MEHFLGHTEDLNSAQASSGSIGLDQHMPRIKLTI